MAGVTVGDLLRMCRQAGLTFVIDADGRRGVRGNTTRRPSITTAIVANRDALFATLRLAERLAVGWQRCDDEPDADRRDALVSFWIELLHDYEAHCNFELAVPLDGRTSEPSELRPRSNGGSPVAGFPDGGWRHAE